VRYSTNAGHANWFVSYLTHSYRELGSFARQFVLAITDPSASASKGMTGFVVDADSPGILLGKKEINMGRSVLDFPEW
jgi:acyl-CoA dehydrogenase